MKISFVNACVRAIERNFLCPFSHRKAKKKKRNRENCVCVLGSLELACSLFNLAAGFSFLIYFIFVFTLEFFTLVFSCLFGWLFVRSSFGGSFCFY